MPSNRKSSIRGVDQIIADGNNSNIDSSTTYYEDIDDDDIDDQQADYHDISDLILNAHDDDDEDVANAHIDKNVNLVYEENPFTLRRFVKSFFHSNRYHVFIIILVCFFQ